MTTTNLIRRSTVSLVNYDQKMEYNYMVKRKRLFFMAIKLHVRKP